MPASTTFRFKGGGARISVNLSAETLDALDRLTAGDTSRIRYEVNRAIQEAANPAPAGSLDDGETDTSS